MAASGASPLPIAKLVLLGSHAVGKSCMLERFVKGTFSKYTIGATIGAAFAPFVLQKDDKPFAKLEIWDTAGQEQFESLAPMYYRGAEGALLVFDLGSEESFESMKHWSEELGNNGQDGVCMVVCGNKLDMVTADDSLRVVESVDAQRFADSIGAEYFETSARTGTNVTTAFSRLTEEIMAKRRAQAGEAMPSFEELRGRHDSVALGGSGSDGSGGKPGSRKCC